MRSFLWTYLQGRNRDADIENGLVDTGDEKGGTNWESSTDTYSLLCLKQLASGKRLYSTGSQFSVLWWPRWWNGGEKEAQKGKDICTQTVDSQSCAVETNTTL